MKKILVLSAVVAIFALAFPLTAMAASGPNDTKIILGSSYRLESGDVLDSDLLVMGGNVDLDPGSVVQGSAFILGGNINIAGEVDGDVGVLGGNVTLMSGSVVRGDVSSLGGNIIRADGAVIEGEFSSNFGIDIDSSMPDFPSDFDFSWPTFSFPRISPWISVLWSVFRVFVIAALALLVVMFWPEPTRRIADAAIGQPLAAGGLGLLTAIAGPVLLLVLLITILLAPLSVIGFVLFVAAGVFGWIGLGYEVGRRIALAMKWDLQDPAAAGLGTLLLSAVAGGIGFIPCVGWLLVVLAASLGLGAVMLTRFGSQAYLGSVSSAVPAPVEPEPKAAPKKRSPKKVADKK
jgi:cytoskeletal protein CcmA (bactofilin family)